MIKMLILEKDDIITSPHGLNICIKPPGTNLEIIFQYDAAIEFCNDVKKILLEQDITRHTEKEYQEIVRKRDAIVEEFFYDNETIT